MELSRRFATNTMKTLLALLLATLCAVASASGQTIRTLGFNTTNGQVVANTGTNTLTFTNAGVAFGGDMTISGPVIAGSGVSFSFEDADFAYGASIVRQNLGFSTNLNTLWTATNASNARSAVGLGATWLTNTNVTNFRTAIGLGATNTVQFDAIHLQQSGETSNSITYWTDGLEVRTGGDVYFQTDASGSVVFYKPILFDTLTNIVAVTRTNLGLPLPALTNGNVTNFRSAIGLPWSGLTNTNRNTFRIALELEGTNAIPVQRAYELYDGANEAVALSAGDADLVAGPYLLTTNAPTNTTNVVRWIQVTEGTNFYKLPLYQ
jgi:hypothetical protein